MDLRNLAAFFEGPAQQALGQLTARLRDSLGARYEEDMPRYTVGDLYGRLFEASHRVLVTQYKLIEAGTTFEEYCALLRQPPVRDYINSRYPMLAASMAVICRHWVEQSALLLERFCADEAAIRRSLLPGGRLRIASVRPGAGDTHRGGRSVATIRFEDGRKLVYKPRSLAVDGHFQELLGWVNRTCGADFRTLALVVRDDYGWVEHVPHAPCTDAEQVERYYERLGGLLCLLHVLGATDFHCENLIAMADQPQLIDLEGFFHPVSRAHGAESNESYDSSVLRVGILPTRFLVEDATLPEMGGIVDASGQLGIERLTLVQEGGSVSFGRERAPIAAGHNVPFMEDGSPVELGEAQVGRLQEGFARMYRAILGNREGFAQQLAMFRDDEVRVLFRHTATYSHLLAESRHPTLMASQEATDEHFALLHRVVDEFRMAAHFVPFEIADLARGDVPQFTVRVDGRDLWCGDQARVVEFFERSGYDAALRKLDLMSEDDLAQQQWMIAHAIGRHRNYSAPQSGVTQSDPGGRPVRQRLVDIASSIGRYVAGQVNTTGGEAHWLVHKSAALDNTRFQLVPALHDLHSGMPGEILFFQQLARVTGDEAYEALRQGALRHLRRRLSDSGTFGAIRPLGLYTGWGGVIFMLARMKDADDGATCLAWASEILADPRIEALVCSDRGYGVTSGGAGFILACLELHYALPSARAIELAEMSAQHLLAHRCKDAPGHAWKIESSRPLSGFAHGASGFAVAFASLHAVTGNRDYLDAALGALEYESTLYLPLQRNWRDCRGYAEANPSQDAASTATTWAHGAPGIGLARLALMELGLDTGEIRRDLDVALATTIAYGVGRGGHSLLAGAFGNVELPLCHARMVGGDESAAFVMSASGQLARDIEAGDLRLSSLASPPLGLMPGITGVGYQCLRLAFPDQVPSILCGPAVLPRRGVRALDGAIGDTATPV